MNAKQRRLKRRERIRKLNHTGEAYAVIDGNVVEDVEIPEDAPSVRKRTPVTLDGQTFREVPEDHPKKRSVSDDGFGELLRMRASAMNAVHSHKHGKEELISPSLGENEKDSQFHFPAR